MISVINIIQTISSKILYLRTLDHVFVETDTISVGNNAVTARCRIMGREGKWLIKCYYRKKSNLERIYDTYFYPKELSLYSIDGRMESIDVVVMPWIEGKTLDSYIGAADSDYPTLSKSFDRLAYTTLSAEYAHGDIKPDNIIVRENMEMVLIDFDGMWAESYGMDSMEEMGTKSYRHPRRDRNYCSKSIDDYPIALISTALAALSLERKTMEQYINADGTLFDPQQILNDRDRALNTAKEIFMAHGDAAHYRIASALNTPYPSIYNLRSYFLHATHPAPDVVKRGAEAEREGMFWGYKCDGEWVVPPLYESCDDPKHGACRMMLGKRKIYLPIEGESLPDIEKLENNTLNSGKQWTIDDDTRLATHIFDGHRLSTIARHLGRSETAIRARIAKLQLPLTESNHRR